MKKHQKKHHKDGAPAPHHRPQLYGFHAVSEAWLNPSRRTTALYLTEQAKSGFESVHRKAQKLCLKRCEAYEIDKKQLDKMLPAGAVHQGIALACENLPETDIQDIVIRAAQKPDSLIVILDQVTDPHNVGAILRSACAFGIDGIVMQKKHAPALDGVLAKTACGAVEHTPVAYETNLSRSIEALQGAGYFVYGLDERGEQHIGQIKKGGKTALVLGAEGPGIRHLVKEHCDALVRLPATGPIQSLNVSNAAAISFYALKP